MKLYVYDHCPFSMRPRLIAGLKQCSMETIILPFSDQKTPISYIGKKICPFLVLDSNQTKTESLDLAFYLDSLIAPNILTTQSISQTCNDLIKTFLKTIVALTAPQFITIPYPEFQTQNDILPFQKREEEFIGHSLTKTEEKFTTYQTQIDLFFIQAEQLLTSSLTKNTIQLTCDECVLFAYFRNLLCVKDLDIPKKIKTFTHILANQANIALY